MVYQSYGVMLLKIKGQKKSQVQAPIFMYGIFFFFLWGKGWGGGDERDRRGDRNIKSCTRTLKAIHSTLIQESYILNIYFSKLLKSEEFNY